MDLASVNSPPLPGISSLIQLFFFPSQEAVLWDDQATDFRLFINSNKNAMFSTGVLWSLAWSLAHQMLHHVACYEFLLL